MANQANNEHHKRMRSRDTNGKERTKDGYASSSLVTFNVGGTKYQVSRSLMDQHPDTMLSRMVSDTWQTEEDGADDEEGCFIERNGARFAYVLDYMRDGCVSIPGGNSACTKSAMLNELQYFGFGDVDAEAIQVEFSHIDAPKYIARLTKDFQLERDDLVRSRDELNSDILCLTIAHGICVRRMKSESDQIAFSIVVGKPLWVLANRKHDNCSLKPRDTQNLLDFEVIEAVNNYPKHSLSSTLAPLNNALLKYGLKALTYKEERADYNAREVLKVEGVVKVSMSVEPIL